MLARPRLWARPAQKLDIDTKQSTNISIGYESSNTERERDLLR